MQITIDQIKDLGDSDFEKLGITAIGTRIKIKQAVDDYSKGILKGSTKENVYVLTLFLVERQSSK